MKRALLALLALVLASCVDAKQAVLVSGSSLDAVADQYVATSEAFRVLCTGGVLAHQTCDEWAVFQARFRLGFKVAQSGHAAAAGGFSAENDAAWAQLVGELSHFILIATRAPALPADGGAP